jgi:hypothetical protein
MAERFSLKSDDQDDMIVFDALCALEAKDVGPLVTLLEAEDGQLHPLLQRKLASLLNEQHRTLAMKVVEKKKDRGRPQGRSQQLAERDRSISRRVHALMADPPNPKFRSKKYTCGKVAEENSVSPREVERALAREDIRLNKLRRFLRGRGDTDRLRKFMQAHAAQENK